MDMVEIVKQVLQGNKDEINVLADWLQDNKSEHPEFQVYHRKLLSKTISIQTLFDVVIKFGPQNQRNFCMTVIRKVIKYNGYSKPVTLAFMKKASHFKWIAEICLKVM